MNFTNQGVFIMDLYDEIIKCYEGVTEEHASTSFEMGIMNDLYYQLFSRGFLNDRN